jgi:NADPH-dependent 2,4-dienoyl-CoA reductase/sulfur reductase-like enzyme
VCTSAILTATELRSARTRRLLNESSLTVLRRDAVWHCGEMGGSPNRIAVVGASLAGLRAAETLIQRSPDIEVVVVGAEPHRPYDRPPLSKKLLSGEWEPDRIHLRPADSFDELDVEWRFGVAASRLELDASGPGGRLDLSDGSTLDADGIIIATGASPRRLPGQSQFSHVRVLRTLDDAMAVRAAIASGGQRVVVIGAGFIGLEVAATAKQLDNQVTVIEGAAAPLIRGLGEEMGAAVADVHRARGVDLRCGVQVESLTDTGVQLAGEHLDADLIVVGIGVVPATQWLDDSGLELRDGIVCDETLLAAPGIYAAGDVARWPNPLFEEEMRVEHWTNAAEQGALAANNLLDVAAGEPPASYGPVPFFWSDQFDQRIQFLGRSSPDDDVVVAAGSIAEGKLLALYGRDGKLHGAFGLNAPRWVMPMRKQLLNQVSLDDAVAFAATLA